MILEGKSHLNATFTGKLSSEPVSEPHILLLEKPTFQNMLQLTLSNAVIFTSKLSSYSHETLLFNDYCIPAVSEVSADIFAFLGEEVTIYCKDGKGIITDQPADLFPIPSMPKLDSAFTSTIRGMKFCLNLGASNVATRGEFLYFHSSKISPIETIQSSYLRNELAMAMEEIITFGAKNFTQFFYRFSDFADDFIETFQPLQNPQYSSTNPSLGNRGTSRLLKSHLDLFLFEIGLISSIALTYENISLVLPYVRTINEANEAEKLVRKHFKGKVGCMIEVPAILFRSKQLDTLFDFFIVGCSDLLQLTQGTDRAIGEYDEDTYRYIAECLGQFFLREISPSKPVYITSEKIYSLIIGKFPNVQLLDKNT